MGALKVSDYINFGVCCDSAANYEFTVPVSGRYYLELRSGSVGPYKLSVQSKGTPIVVPNPATAGCLKGRVESLTYSLQLIAVGLPDEMSIGGTRACTTCTIKAPGYPEITNRLGAALLSKINVEACYDASGNIFRVKLVQP